MKLSHNIFFVCLLLACSKDEVQDATYALPYEVGQAFEVIQGNGGSFSHTGNFFYSLDFEMNIGTTITAARGGVVVNVQESFVDANRTPGQENYVIIQHSDGSYGRYFHLTKDGALVTLGQSIQKGDPIGLSGDTGYSTLPHLHFDVTIGCALPAPDCPTIAIEFVNSLDKVPVSDKSYEALPF